MKFEISFYTARLSHSTATGLKFQVCSKNCVGTFFTSPVTVPVRPAAGKTQSHHDCPPAATAASDSDDCALACSGSLTCQCLNLSLNLNI